MRIPAIVLLLGLAAPAAQAQMYKCVDERGRVTYADKPQPGCKGGPVDIQPIPSISGAAPAPAARPENAVQDADLRRRMAEREQRLATEKQALEERCTKIRQELDWLSSGTRVSRINDAGERVFMDDATREQRIGELRDQARACP
jgi:hypothetical protein